MQQTMLKESFFFLPSYKYGHFKRNFFCGGKVFCWIYYLKKTTAPTALAHAFVDLRANLISTEVSASHRKWTQMHATPGQTESQVHPKSQLASQYLRLRLAKALRSILAL